MNGGHQTNRVRIACCAAIVAAALALPACVANPRPRTRPDVPVRERSTSILLHGKPLELHVSVPQAPAGSDVLVLFASGDGGWFGTAVDMFRTIGRAGYQVVGFSARAFLKLDRPRGTLVNATQLAEEYAQILARARDVMRLDATTPAILTGWSRGAAFAVLAGAEPSARPLQGVVAIGLDEGEDLQVNGPDDETDDGPGGEEHRQWPFEPYARIPSLGPVPCAVIQASRDQYFPASKARALFGPDTPVRRLYVVDAKNHRFSGGKAEFATALLDAIRWMAPVPERRGEEGSPVPAPHTRQTPLMEK